MGRRTLLLIAALVVAALGTVLIFVYVQNVKNDAEGGAEPVEVLVATQEVSAGTTASDASEAGAFELQTIPRDAAADGALSDISIISDQVALTPIYPGQQILAQMFGGESSRTTLGVPNGKLAMSVQLGDPERVAGFVVPGSRVVVFATLGGDTGVVVQEVEVIGAGATTLSTQTTTTDEGESTTEQIPLAILTLAVEQKEAERIINAQATGQLYFGLLGPGMEIRRPSITTTKDVFR